MKLRHPFMLPLSGGEPCTQLDPEMFYEESASRALFNLPILRRVCSECPILNECAEHAVAHEEYGFWGGLTAAERKILRRKRGQKLVSPVAYNDRIVAAKKAELKERERDDMRRMPKRSDLKWRVAKGGKGGTSTA